MMVIEAIKERNTKDTACGPDEVDPTLSSCRPNIVDATPKTPSLDDDSGIMSSSSEDEVQQELDDGFGSIKENAILNNREGYEVEVKEEYLDNVSLCPSVGSTLTACSDIGEDVKPCLVYVDSDEVEEEEECPPACDLDSEVKATLDDVLHRVCDTSLCEQEDDEEKKSHRQQCE
jgi:hypothetical protein